MTYAYRHKRVSRAAAPVAPRFNPLSWRAPPDAGQTNDPTVDATAYSASATYRYGNTVSTAGAAPYFICIVKPTYAARTRYSISGIATSDTSVWWPCANFYYVDNSVSPGTGVGSATPATAKANPFQSLAEIYTVMYLTGATPRYSVFLLKRGQTFQGSIYLNGTNGGSHSFFLVSAWGAQGSARPLIQYRNINAAGVTACIASSYNNPVTNFGGKILNVKCDSQRAMTILITVVSSTITIGDVLLGSISGCSVTVLEKVGSAVTLGLLTGGEISGLRTADTLTVTSGTNVGASVTIGTAGAMIGGIVLRGFDFDVVNSETTYSGNAGISGGTNIAGSGDRFFVMGCYVHDCQKLGGASPSPQPWSANGSGLGCSVGDGVVMVYNTLDNNGISIFSHNVYNDDMTNHLFQYNWSTNAPQGFGYNLHGVSNTVDIVNNWFDSNNNAISPSGAYARAESETNVTVAGNIIANSGYGAGNTQGIGIFADSCLNFKVYNNLFWNNKSSTVKFQVSTSGGADQLMTNLFFDHNTIYELSYAFDMQPGAFINWKHRNNAWYVLTASSGQYAFNKNTAMSDSEMDSNHNLYFAPNKTAGAAQQVVQWNSVAYTLAALLTAQPTKESGSIYGDPLFKNAASNDFTPLPGSPMLLAGTPVAWITTDFYGRTRNATTPTIGAVES
jgi:hypothetical protein